MDKRENYVSCFHQACLQGSKLMKNGECNKGSFYSPSYEVSDIIVKETGSQLLHSQINISQVMALKGFKLQWKERTKTFGISPSIGALRSVCTGQLSL